MAAVAKLTRRESLALLVRIAISPAMIATYVVVLTLPWWAGPMIYFYLWTLLAVPSAALVSFAIAALSTYALWAWITMVREGFRLAKAKRALRLAAEGGDGAAGAQLRSMRQTSLPIWKHATGFIAVQLIIPPAVAIALRQEALDAPWLIKDHGVERRTTPEEGVKSLLQSMQRRGVYRPFIVDD